MHRADAKPARPREPRDRGDTSAWSACVEGYMFILINEGHRGGLDLVPLRDDDGSPLACTPEVCAVGGRTPTYRVQDGRLVKESPPGSDGGC